MSFRYVNVKRYKRGANWPLGQTRICTRCQIERSRGRQAVVVAELRRSGSRFKLPVAYCEHHLPEDLQGEEE